MTPRDYAKLALGTLSRCLDSSSKETNGLYLVAKHLRAAGLIDMADVVVEAAGRICGDDSDLCAVRDRLDAMLDEWPVRMEEAA